MRKLFNVELIMMYYTEAYKSNPRSSYGRGFLFSPSIESTGNPFLFDCFFYNSVHLLNKCSILFTKSCWDILSWSKNIWVWLKWTKPISKLLTEQFWWLLRNAEHFLTISETFFWSAEICWLFNWDFSWAFSIRT